MKEIIITKRENDFHAHLSDSPEIWGNGHSENEAIGNLIKHHPEQFNITVKQVKHETAV